MMNKTVARIALLTTFLMCWGLIGSLDFKEEVIRDDNYCFMVELNRQDRDNGWPDYNNNYDEVCNVR